jgi:hypothetical protein
MLFPICQTATGMLKKYRLKIDADASTDPGVRGSLDDDHVIVRGKYSEENGMTAWVYDIWK